MDNTTIEELKLYQELSLTLSPKGKIVLLPKYEYSKMQVIALEGNYSNDVAKRMIFSRLTTYVIKNYKGYLLIDFKEIIDPKTKKYSMYLALAPSEGIQTLVT